MIGDQCMRAIWVVCVCVCLCVFLAQPCLSFGFARRVVCVCACVCAVSLCTCRAFLLVASRP